MPTILRIGPYRFFFYAGDKDEPPHIHVERDQNTAKFWLDPPRLHSSGGFARMEMNKIYKILVEYQDNFLENWHDYFGD